MPRQIELIRGFDVWHAACWQAWRLQGRPPPPRVHRTRTARPARGGRRVFVRVFVRVLRGVVRGLTRGAECAACGTAERAACAGAVNVVVKLGVPCVRRAALCAWREPS